MSTVWQICEGFNKKTLIGTHYPYAGNWDEERQFNKQAFRENPDIKKARPVE